MVALESTLITHGLPRPKNLEVARALEAAVREAGAGLPVTPSVRSGGVLARSAHMGPGAAGIVTFPGNGPLVAIGVD